MSGVKPLFIILHFYSSRMQRDLSIRVEPSVGLRVTMGRATIMDCIASIDVNVVRWSLQS